MKPEDEQLMIRYLTGDISETDRDIVEARFFADESYYQHLLLVEDDLIYDYLRGALAPDQKRKIKSRMTASPALNRKIRAVQAVMSIDSPAPSSEPAIAKQPGKWMQMVTRLLVLRKPAIGFALAAILLIASASYYLFTQTHRFTSEIARIEQEREMENLAAIDREQQMQRELDEAKARSERLLAESERERQLRTEAEVEARRLRSHSPASIASFILMPGLTRGSDEPERIVISRGINKVEFKLDLEGEERYRSFRAELRTIGGNLMSSQTISSASGKTVTMTLPANILTNGEYEITLLGSTNAVSFETVYYYYFLVMKR